MALGLLGFTRVWAKGCAGAWAVAANGPRLAPSRPGKVGAAVPGAGPSAVPFRVGARTEKRCLRRILLQKACDPSIFSPSFIESSYSNYYNAVLDHCGG